MGFVGDLEPVVVLKDLLVISGSFDCVDWVEDKGLSPPVAAVGLPQSSQLVLPRLKFNALSMLFNK